MELNFYSDLSDGCAQNVEFLDSQPYGGFSEDNKVGRMLNPPNVSVVSSLFVETVNVCFSLQKQETVISP